MFKKILLLAPQVNIDGHGSMAEFYRTIRSKLLEKYNTKEIICIDANYLDNTIKINLPQMIKFYLVMIVYIFKKKKIKSVISMSQEYIWPIFLNKQIVIHHDIIQYHFPRNKVVKLFYKYFIPFIYPKLKCVYYISETTKNDTNNLIRKKINWQGPTYVPIPLKSSKNKSKVRKFLWVGTASKHKQLDYFLQAMKHLNLDFECVVPESDFQQTVKLINELKISKGKVLHSLTSEELNNKYMESEYFANTSLLEGFGMPILEALLNNCICFAPKTSINIELFDGYIEMYNPNKLDSFISAFKGSTCNQPPAKSTNLASNIKKTFDKFLDKLLITIEQ